ncbi:MAG: DUF4468 domain-containing protein [Bacteroidales bacterium]
MKFSLILINILLGCSLLYEVAAQTASTGLPLDPETNKITYKDVVNQEGNPGYLYDKAIQWFGYYYLSPASVFSVQDRTNGKVEGLGRLRIYNSDSKTGAHTDGGMVTYLIKIEFKENRFRYTITDFSLKLASRYPIEKWMNKSDPAYNPNWDLYLFQVDTTMQRLVLTLKEKMKPTVVKKDEW